MDQDEQHQSKRVGDDVTLAALDLLACVIARNPAAFRGFHTLTVDDAGAGRSLAALQFASGGDKDMVDALPQPDIAPGVEITPHRRGWREVLRQRPPLAAAAGDVEDGVHDVAHVGGARPTARFGGRDQRCHHSPLAVCQIRWIAQVIAVMLTASGIIPGHRAFLSNVAIRRNHNPMISLNYF